VPISGFGDGLDAWRFLILPVLHRGHCRHRFVDVRWYRTIFLEEINKDYVRTARAKGLPETAVFFRHVLKNALIPILTGVVVVIPLAVHGLAAHRVLLRHSRSRQLHDRRDPAQDFAVVRSMVFIGSVLYIVGLILTDISYTLVDPRIRFE
jgi:peptide/nickel transport system permease protein